VTLDHVEEPTSIGAASSAVGLGEADASVVLALAPLRPALDDASTPERSSGAAREIPSDAGGSDVVDAPHPALATEAAATTVTASSGDDDDARNRMARR
jgi:hypothetical protein